MEVNENLYYLIRFVAETTREPKTREVYEGRKIGYYLQNIRKGDAKISEEDKVFLERIGIRLHTENPKEKVHKKLLLLVEFLESYKRWPTVNDYYKGIDMSVFLANILSGNTSLSEQDRKLLNSTIAILPPKPKRRTR